MDQNEYLIQSKNTLAGQDSEQRTLSKQELIDSLDGAYSGNVCDMLKRKVFYKDENAYDRYVKNSEQITNIVREIQDDYVEKELSQNQMDLYHAMLGVLSEGGELIEAITVHIQGKPLDVTNLKEEVGDILWYLAIICRNCGFSFEEAMQTNIDKLSTRYPDKFTTEKAVNRDLDKERKVLDSF